MRGRWPDVRCYVAMLRVNNDHGNDQDATMSSDCSSTPPPCYQSPTTLCCQCSQDPWLQSRHPLPKTLSLAHHPPFLLSQAEVAPKYSPTRPPMLLGIPYHPRAPKEHSNASPPPQLKSRIPLPTSSARQKCLPLGGRGSRPGRRSSEPVWWPEAWEGG